MPMASSSGCACTAMRVRGRSGMGSSVGEAARRRSGRRLAGQVCRSPTRRRAARARPATPSGGAIGRTTNLEKPDVEEALDHGAQAREADRDDLLERPPAGPAGQRRRGQRGHVGALGRVGQADAEVLGADGPPVLGGHPVDHRLAGARRPRACRRPGSTRRPGGRSARARPGGCRPARRRRGPAPAAARPRRRRRTPAGPSWLTTSPAHSRRSTGSASSISAPRGRRRDADGAALGADGRARART